VFIHDIEFAGESCTGKFKRVKKTLFSKLKDTKADKIAVLITRLDDISWITNLRGSDIPYNPVFFSFAILYFDDDKEHLALFADKDKFNSESHKQHLKENNIQLFNYNEIYSKLITETDGYLLITAKDSMNENLYNIITKNKKLGQFKIIDNDVVKHTKCIKTERELNGLRDCNLRVGAALVNYLAWLEREVNKKNNITEYEAAIMSAKFRAKQKYYMGESFSTISSTGPNAAIIHYKPEENDSALIKNDQIYLIDSGGQFV
jgi:Xaa-Pro aminopeptidase